MLTHYFKTGHVSASERSQQKFKDDSVYDSGFFRHSKIFLKLTAPQSSGLDSD